MFDAIVVVLAVVGIFALVNISVGSTKKAKKAVARKRAIRPVQPALSRLDKVMGRAGYQRFTHIYVDKNDGKHEYLAEMIDNHLALVYEVIAYDDAEFDLVSVNQGEYANVA